MGAHTWKSLRGAKATWGEDEVTELATAWYENLPQSAKALMEDKASKWRGGAVVAIKDVQWIPKEPDLVNNAYPFIKETVKRFGGRAPSSYFFADCFLAMHTLTGTRLLVVRSAGETERSLALAEGGKLKKLLQYLRGLWRETPKGARHPIIAELKALLVKVENKRSSPAALEDASPEELGDGLVLDAERAAHSVVVSSVASEVDSNSVEATALTMLEKVFGSCLTWSPELSDDIETLLGDLPAEVVV